MTIKRLSLKQERSSMIKVFYELVVLESCSMTIKKLSQSQERSSMIRLFYG